MIDLPVIGDFRRASGIEKIARRAVVQRVHNERRCVPDALQFFFIFDLPGCLRATPRSIARHGAQFFKASTSHAGASSPAILLATSAKLGAGATSSFCLAAFSSMV